MCRFLFLIVLGAIVTARSAFAGSETHGGVIIVCRDQATRGIDVSRLRLLDLNEGRTVYGLTISQNLASADEQLQEVIRRLSFDQLLKDTFIAELNQVRRGMTFTSPDVGLELLPDVSLIPSAQLDKDCRYEQLAIYQQSGEVKVSLELYNRLDNRNLAAFFTHEVIYKLNRVSTGVNRSVEAREMTARLFADNWNQEMFKLLADRKLTTIPNRLSNGRTKIKLQSFEPIKITAKSVRDLGSVSVNVDSPFTSLQSVHIYRSGFPFTAGNVEKMIDLDEYTMPYSVLKFEATKKKQIITLSQNGVLLKDEKGRSEFAIDTILEIVLVP